jgi:hypothetical protein
LAVALVVVLFIAARVAVWGAPSPAMRPYSGIGIALLTVSAEGDHDLAEPLRIYREPALSRLGDLDPVKAYRNEQVFGRISGKVPMIVTARRGEWLRVVYDDAGREAWLNPGRKGAFQSWDEFLKGVTCRLPAGLSKQYYQLYRQPGAAVSGVLTPRQLFRTLKLQGDWALVMPDQNTLGWLRWRDDDGRTMTGASSSRWKPCRTHKIVDGSDGCMLVFPP